ncbi:chromatin-remodeling complex subunit ies6 [Marasmius crinis-equi]|uniref:Chromatin-remodeling complex subunit ies6 n=1 Tax=Marasmius crinis-equi TaxID=585013 RepID=A0ABR3FQL4_9AGAR
MKKIYHHVETMPPKGGRKKIGASDGTSTPLTPSLAERLSYLHEPRPFKNPNYTKNVNRRAKNLKNVLTQERERERAERERRLQEKAEGGGMDVDGEDVEMPTYTSIEAPPSFLPQKHWCDITGLEAPYTDPTTGLRYHDKDVFALIKGMSASIAKDYLSALFALAHLAACTVQLVLHAAFRQPVISGVITGLEMIVIAWFITIALVKPILKMPHTIIHEIASSFLMFTLSIGSQHLSIEPTRIDTDLAHTLPLVLALVALTAPINAEEIAKPHVAVIVGVWLRILVFTSFARVVSVTYDRSIWVRNMDGSPSPFSISILLSFMLPCFFEPYDTAYTASLTPRDGTVSAHDNLCIDPRSCNCPPLKRPMMVDETPAAANETTTAQTAATPQTDPQTDPGPSRTRNSLLSISLGNRSSMSLSKSLVQIPDAAQRRMSYPVALPRCQDDAMLGNIH